MALFGKSIFILLLTICPLVVYGDNQSINWNQLLDKANPALQAEWAARFEHGEGVSQDYGRAIELYCAAANQGYAPAQYQLGWLYANGRGVERDDALAAAWFRLAAKGGYSQAKNMLAIVATHVKQRATCVFPGALQFTKGSGKFSRQHRQVEQWVRRLAPDYGLDPILVLAVIQAESSFNSQARSPKNAQGLMQLMPETAARFGIQNPLDPIQNLHGGMSYLRWLLAFFQGNVRLALAGYNAGEQAVLKYHGVPPYAETLAYVRKIIQLYGRLTHPPVEAVVAPAPILAALQTREVQ
jgi:soluble lytic murein transglycosylase-like protein